MALTNVYGCSKDGLGSGNVDVASQRMEANGNNYQRFNESAEGSTAEWIALIVTVKKLPSWKNMKAFHGNRDCPICHEEFTSSSKQCTIKCKHAFHRECVMEWQKRGNTTCPMCRDSFEWVKSVEDSWIQIAVYYGTSKFPPECFGLYPVWYFCVWCKHYHIAGFYSRIM